MKPYGTRRETDMGHPAAQRRDRHAALRWT